MDTPKFFTTKLIGKKQVTWKVCEAVLQLTEPTEINFIPGQFVNLSVGNFMFRSYSIASPNTAKNHIVLLIENGHEGLGSNYIKALNIGDETKFIGPAGRLELYTPLPSKLYFLATGTGLAPFISMFHGLQSIKYSGQIRLTFGARKESELFYLDKLEQFKKDLKDFDYQIIISQPEQRSQYSVGRVTDILPNFIENEVQYYVCGHPLMVSDAFRILTEKGIDSERIIVEGFTRKIA